MGYKRSDKIFAMILYHTLVTLIGRKLDGMSGGLSAFGIAVRIAKNSSLWSSPSATHYHNKEHILSAKISFANRVITVETSNPKHPGEAPLFIRETLFLISATLKGSFKLAIYATDNYL